MDRRSILPFPTAEATLHLRRHGHHRRLMTVHMRMLVLMGTTIALAACGSTEPVAPATGPITDPTKLYMALTLDRPAITMDTLAPYDTLRLTATPRDALGNPMVGLGMPTFTSSDTTKVRVTPDGFVTAVGAGLGARVYATLKVGPVSHADTAQINVTHATTFPELANLSIDPVPPDSGKWSLSYGSMLDLMVIGYLYHPSIQQVTPRITSTIGDTLAVSGLQVRYTSLDPTIASIDRWSGDVTIYRPGQVAIVAQTTVYGISRADTTTFTVTPPIGGDVAITAGPAGTPVLRPDLGDDSPLLENILTEIHVTPGGIVMWRNYLNGTQEIKFDDPTNVAQPTAEICQKLYQNVAAIGTVAPGVALTDACGAGDVLVPAEPEITGYSMGWVFTVRLRQFPVPGVYPFHITGTGFHAKIVVGEL